MKINFPTSLLVVIAFLVAVFFLINNSSKNMVPENIKYVAIAGVNVKVDLSLTASEHERGLSGRERLESDQGMLFVFETPGRYSFWMKDMNFPIDMIWITHDMKVAYIKKNALPEKYPETYGPSLDSKYVLEVDAGFSDENSLKEGDSIVFSY